MMMKSSKEVQWVKLGDFIHQLDIRNHNNTYTLDNLRGLSINKVFIPTKANMEGVSLTPYKLVPPKSFCYVTITSRNSDKITLALNESTETYIVSSSYIVFYCAPDKKLLPEYLFLWFNMPEFDRYARFNSWGSAREAFSWESMTLIEIPVPFKDGEPDIERQKEVVDIWQGLRRLKEENEAIAKPLLDLCDAKMDELKHSAPMAALGPYIEPKDERNSDLSITLSQGISNMKYFQNPKQTAANSRNDKIVRKGQFAYNRATTRNGEKISIAYRDDEDCTVSSAYQIFELTNHEDFLPHYLMLWFMRPEFDRYARYMSKGSAHEFFEYDEMCRVKVPKPSIEIQQAIVDIYHCARRAKAIAEEANQQLKSICPALMQYIIHSAV